MHHSGKGGERGGIGPAFRPRGARYTMTRSQPDRNQITRCWLMCSHDDGDDGHGGRGREGGGGGGVRAKKAGYGKGKH